MNDHGQQPVIATQPGKAEDHDQFSSSDEVIVRPMNASDTDFVGDMVVESFKEKFVYKVGAGNLDFLKDAFADEFRSTPALYPRIFIAEMGGQRAGMMLLTYHGDKFEKSSEVWNRISCYPLCRLKLFMWMVDQPVLRGHCYLDWLCVKDHFRGKGIGKALLTVADQDANSHNCQLIYLWVTSTNRAQNLYRRQGYQVTETSNCGPWFFASGVRNWKKMEKHL